MAVKNTDFKVSISIDDKTNIGFKEAEKSAQAYIKSTSAIGKNAATILEAQEKALKFAGKERADQIVKMSSEASILRKELNLTNDQIETMYDNLLTLKYSDMISEEEVKKAQKGLEDLAIATGKSTKILELYATETVRFHTIMETIAEETRLKTILAITGISIAYFKIADTIKYVQSIFSNFKVSNLTLVKALMLSSPVLIAFGKALEDSDSKFLRFISKVSIIAGLIMGVLTTSIAFGIAAIGKFAESIGDKLMASMEAFEIKAQEFQATTSQFIFTIKGFTKEFGVAAIGSSSAWEEAILKIRKSTAFGTKEITKTASFLIKEGAALGLMPQEMEKLLKRSADIAAITGRDIEETAQNVVSALIGQSQALSNQGVMINDVSLAHSKYVQNTGKTVDELSELEKRQARFNLIIEKSVPIVGAAASQLDTVSGAYARLNNAMLDIERRLGSQGKYTLLLINIQARLAESISSLPKPILEAIGQMQDFLGVTLKITGVFLKYAFSILGVVFAYKILIAVLSQTTLIQMGLNKILHLLAPVIGRHIVLTKIWTASQLTLTNVTKVFIGILARGLLVALRMIGVVLIKILAIIVPVVVAITLLGTILYGLVKAFQELVLETKFFNAIWETLRGMFFTVSDAIMGVSSNFMSFKDILEAIIGVAARFIVTIKDIIKFFISGLAQGAIFAAIGILKLTSALSFSKAKQAKYAAQISDLKVQLAELTNTSVIALASVVSFGEQTAVAATKADILSIGMGLMGKKTKENREELERLIAVQMKGFDRVAERLKVLGTEYDKALIARKEAQKAIKLAETLNADAAEKAKAMAEARINLFKAELDIEKLRLDKFKEFETSSKSLEVERLKADGKNIEAIQLEFKEKKNVFEQDISNLRKVGKISKEQQDLINKIRGQLGAAETAAISAERMQKLREDLDRMKDKLDDLKDKTKELELVEMGRYITDRELVAFKLAQDIKEVSALEEQFKLMGKMTPEIKAQIDIYKRLAEAKAATQIEETPIQVGDVINTFKNAGKYIGETWQGATEDAWGTFAKAGGEVINWLTMGLSNAFNNFISWIKKANISDIMTSSMEFIGSTIAKIFDPATWEGIADMFTILVDLPEKLMQAFSKLGDSIIKLIQKLPVALNLFISKLPGIFAKILENIPALIDVVTDALLRLIDIFPALLDQVLSKLPDFIAKIMDRLPEIIMKLSEAIPLVFASIVRSIIKSIPIIMERLPEIIAALTEGTISAIGDMIIILIDELIAKGGIIKIVTSIIKAIPQIVGAFISGLWKGLMHVFSNFWEYLFGNLDLSDTLGDIGAGFEEVVNNITESISRATSQLFEVVDLAAAARGLTVADNISNAINQALTNIKLTFGNLFAWLDNFWRWVWEKVLQPFINALTIIWQWVWDNILMPLANFVKAAWQWVLDTILTPLANIIKVAWQWVVDNVVNVLKTIGSFIWEGLKKSVKSATDFFKDIGVWIWDGLWSKLKDVGKLLTKIFDKLDPSNLFKKIFDTSGAFGGGGTVEKFLQIDVPFVEFAKGGMASVPGQAMVPGDSAINDKILALLSPGEAVIPRSLMAVPWVARLIGQLLGDKMPAFKVGGVVGKVIDAATGGEGSGYNPFNEALSSISGAVGSGAGILTDLADMANVFGEGILAPFKDMQGFLDVSWKNLEAGAKRQWLNVKDKLPEWMQYADPGYYWKRVEAEVMGMVFKMFESNALPKAHSGGFLRGVGEIPLMAQGGEFIVNKRAVNGNLGFLNKLNAGQMNGGGLVIENITINAKTNLDAQSIKREIIPEVEKELKRKSLEGRFVLSAAGIRK